MLVKSVFAGMVQVLEVLFFEAWLSKEIPDALKSCPGFREGLLAA
jgi:hypothetical protein